MRTGILEGDINGLWQVAYDSGELTATTSSVTISGLNGDTDLEYMLISRVNLAEEAPTAPEAVLRFNGDSGSNYGIQRMQGQNTSAGAARFTPTYFARLGYSETETEISFSKCHIFAKSGKERTGLTLEANRITGTTVDAIWSYANVWSNTADEITSMTIAATDDNLGIGARFILLKKVHATDAMKTGELTPNQVTGAWERVYSNTLTSAATTVTISGLTGNTDCVYKLIAYFNNSSASASDFQIRPNNDSGSNYGFQRLVGNNATVAASRNTSVTGLNFAYAAASNVCPAEILIYAKSGYERTAIGTRPNSISGTTVTEIGKWGQSWNNTADEITSLVVFGSISNSLGIGTNIELYKLNL
jgi:hypothetical protein